MVRAVDVTPMGARCESKRERQRGMHKPYGMRASASDKHARWSCHLTARARVLRSACAAGRGAAELDFGAAWRDSIQASMASDFQPTERGPICTGAGKSPALISR